MMMLVLPWRHAVIFLFSPQCSPAVRSTFARFSAVCRSGTRFTLQKFPFVPQSGRWSSQTRLFWVSPLNLRPDLILTGCRSHLLDYWTVVIICQNTLLPLCASRVGTWISTCELITTRTQKLTCTVIWLCVSCVELPIFVCGISSCSIFLMATAASM